MRSLVISSIILLLAFSCQEKQQNESKQYELTYPKNGSIMRWSDSLNLKWKNNHSPSNYDIVLNDNKIEQPIINKQKIGYTSLKVKGPGFNKEIQVLILSNQKETISDYSINKETNHSREDYTQGYEYYNDKLIESTGLYGHSKISIIDTSNQKSLMNVNLSSDYFGEGITVFKDKIYQLTWQSRKCFVYDLELNLIQEFPYPLNIEGWGLTHNSSQLIMSTGSNEIFKIDPLTFTIIEKITIHDFNGKRIDQINELELVGDTLYSNIYMSDWIIAIDIHTGAVLKKYDFSNLLPSSERNQTTDVLNGIAYNKSNNSFLITGKNWPKKYEVKLN